MFKIGLIGTGEMGKPMAKNLLKAGFSLHVYDVRSEPVQELAAVGAIPSPSIKDLAENSEIVISMVRDTATTESIMSTDDGVLGELKSNGIVIITSTIDADYCRELAEQAKEKGIHILDAPVSGGKGGAETGTLSILVGGEIDIFEKCRPVFDALGKNVFYQGSAGMGEATKIANNIIFMLNIAACSEAMKLAEKSGIDPDRFLDILKTGTADSWVVRHWEIISSQKKDFREGRGGAMEIPLKDLRLALAMAENKKLPLPLSSLAARLDWGD